MTIAREHKSRRAHALSENDARAVVDDELLCVTVFARCRKLSVRKAFERLAKMIELGSMREEYSYNRVAGKTPGEVALLALYCTARPDGCMLCGVRHFV